MRWPRAKSDSIESDFALASYSYAQFTRKPVPTFRIVLYTVETAEFFDIEMDDLAGCFAFIADHGLGGLQGFQPVEAPAFENA